MTQVQCKALLFDMDGVLVDSTPAVSRVWRQWAIERGFDPVEVVAHAHGRPSLTTVREYLPQADHEAENKEMERRELNDLDGVVALPGALELLSQLPTSRWAIVTSSTRSLAMVRLQAAGIPVSERLVTASDVKNGKPDPEPYRKAATVLGYDAAQCVVIEDAPAGIHAAKAAGARIVALRTTTSDAVLRAAGADWVLNNCQDISATKSGNDLLLDLSL
jgi:mannitol-1-/sugar-/sorbitol-6-phosphatase